MLKIHRGMGKREGRIGKRDYLSHTTNLLIIKRDI